MKVLWISNAVFPDACRHINMKPSVSGGWMYGLAKSMLAYGKVSLAVASVYSGSDFKSFSVNGVHYYLLPIKAARNNLWQQIVSDFEPNIIHVHGTEYPYGYELISQFPDLPSVVSIQGMVSVIPRYYYAGLSFTEIVSNITIRDVIRRDSLFDQKRKMVRQGEIERLYIKSTKAIIGRTDWDYAHVNSIRPGAPYYHCGEVLNEAFYSDDIWSIDSCSKYSIFVSQASYPLKGFHQLLKAVAIARRSCPEIKVRVAGTDILDFSTLSKRIKRTGYAKYLDKLVNKLELSNSIEFLGQLTPDQMKREYLDAHVFVCPSSIENSSNSIGEAQILGVPVIASQVGGIGSMTDGFKLSKTYRFEEVEVLAYLISESFKSNGLDSNLESAKKYAEIRHNSTEIAGRVMDIYKIAMGYL